MNEKSTFDCCTRNGELAMNSDVMFSTFWDVAFCDSFCFKKEKKMGNENIFGENKIRKY